MLERKIVWAVTLNGHLEGVFETPEAADACMNAIRSKKKDNWESPREGYWSSRHVTSLMRRDWVVQ